MFPTIIYTFYVERKKWQAFANYMSFNFRAPTFRYENLMSNIDNLDHLNYWLPQKCSAMRFHPNMVINKIIAYPWKTPRSAHQLNTTLKPFQNLEMKEFGLELPSLINSHIFWRSYILHRIHNTLHPISSSDISPLNLLFLISEEKWTCIPACHVPSFAEAKIGDWFVN